MLILKPEDARIKNSTTILNILMKKDSIPRVELSRSTGLTKTTVSSIINDFINCGIVEESSIISTGNVGKSPIPLHIKKDAIYTIGVHLGRQKVETVLMDARMNIISIEKGLSYEGLGPKGVLEKLFWSIDDSMKGTEKNKFKIGAIGIGVPGPLNAQTGVVSHPPKFRGWENVPLGKIVNERYKLPVWIENDANVGVLAEKWHGGGKDLKNFIYILINEGIGAGVVIDDELYQGAYDYVGEIGHTLFYDHGKFRYLEDISGVDLLIKQARSRGLDIKDIKEIPNLLQKNDRVTKSIVKQLATRIGAAVINVIHIIGPEAVFIGGKMAVVGDALIQPIREIVSMYLFGDQKVDVRLSEISEDAVAVGAAIYATTRWLEKKITELAYAKRR
jgi:predicted NBD/HSP70 family sugar kinase